MTDPTNPIDSTHPKLPKRFMDSGYTLYEMLDEILVVCPQCHACARVTLKVPDKRDWFAPRRFSCLKCGLTRQWASNTITRTPHNGTMTDAFFGLPLWLQASCVGHTLWAFNFEHLTLIESYISADLREHRQRPACGWQNSSLVNRLPRWMTVAKHRDKVLKVIQKLKLER